MDSGLFYAILQSRLAGQLDTVLADLQPDYRNRIYTPAVTLAMFLGQVLDEDSSCRNAIAKANVDRVMEGMPRASQKNGSYCEARRRLRVEIVRALRIETAAAMTEILPEEWMLRGRHAKLIDGTTILMPDTQANQKKYPQHAGQEEGAGFPIARVVSVVSLAHGAILDFRMAAYKGKGTGEPTLLRDQMECFVKDDVGIGDSIYCDYFTMADMLQRGADFVLEQHGARTTDFRRGEKLGKRDHVVVLKKPRKIPDGMTKEKYDSYQAEISVRETRVRSKVIVSSFLNPREVSRRELGRIFAMRWNVELDLRNIKSTLGMEKLSCRTPAMCEKELEVHLLAYNLVRLLMAEAAVQEGVDPRELSFKNTVQVWRAAWSKGAALTEDPEKLRAVFEMIGEIQVGDRPGRVEPRACKQRPKPYARLTTTRRKARARIRRRGHGKKLRVA